MKRNHAYNRGHLHKNESIEAYIVPDIDRQPERKNKRKFTITKFSESLTGAHNHAEFRQQLESDPIRTYAIKESDIVKLQHSYRRHSRILKSEFNFKK